MPNCLLGLFLESLKVLSVGLLLEHFFFLYEESMRELGLFVLEKVQEGSCQVYKKLIGRNEEEGARLVSVVPGDRTRGNGHKLKTHFLVFR